MGRPKTVTDEEIRVTARRCFLEHGPSLSIATIAEQLGVSDAAILKRVGSKEALLRMSLLSKGGAPSWMAVLQQDPQPGPLAPQLVEMLETISAAVTEFFPTLIALRMSSLAVKDMFPKGHLAPPLQARRELSNWFSQASQSHGLHLPDPDAAANLLMSTIESYALRSWISSAAVSGTLDWARLVAGVMKEPSYNHAEKTVE